MININLENIKINYFLCVVLFFTISCNKETHSSIIQKEIKELSTINSRINYLEDIYDIDQMVRKELDSVIKTFGNDSKQFKTSFQKMKNTDNVNIQKIELYLEEYGHPKLELYGKKATMCPWLIIHHSPN